MLINNEFINLKTYEVENPQATIVFSHGIAEHHKRYEMFYGYLNNNKINVVSYDLRGHGRSGGKRGYVKSLDVFIKDLEEITSWTKKRYGDKVFLVGHSMGALISNLYACKNDNISGVIASGAAGDFSKGTNFLRIIPAKLLWFVKIKTNFKDPNLYSDKSHVNSLERDDFLLSYFYLSLIGETMIKGIRRLKRFSANIKVPYLVLHGEEDKIITTESNDTFYNNLQQADKTKITYPKMYHNILNDQSSEKVYEDIVNWIINRL